GPDGPLLRQLHALRREGRWRSTEDLAAFDFNEWCELIESVNPVGDGGDNEDEAGGDDVDRTQARAEAIVAAIEEAFPSACIRRELVATQEVSASAQRIFER